MKITKYTNKDLVSLGIIYGTLVTFNHESNFMALYCDYRRDCCLMGEPYATYEQFKHYYEILLLLVPMLQKNNNKRNPKSFTKSELSKLSHCSLIRYLYVTVELTGDALWDCYVGILVENNVETLNKKEYNKHITDIMKGTYYEKEKK